MRIRALALAAVVSAGATGFAPVKGGEPPVVGASRAPRRHRDLRWSAPAGSLASLPRWRVLWDRDTDVPLRLWGPPLAAPGTAASADAAERTARELLAAHLPTIAPGARASDFALLANVVDRAGKRTVSFAQSASGLPVLGGAVAFTFRHDRLVAISSTALPHVSVRVPAATLSPTAVGSAARAWLRDAGHPVDVKALGARVIVPIVRSRGNAARPLVEYRVAETVEVAAQRGAGAWQVWIDAATAGPIARQTQLSFASGSVLYDTPDRHPRGTRSARPAPDANHTIDGMMVRSSLDGSVTWAGDAVAQLAPGLSGPFVRLTNKAGALATETLALQPGGAVTWSRASDELGDAQLTAFVAASAAKQFARTHLAPGLAWLDQPLPVNVNESQTCNAYSTGDSIHFYKASTSSIGGSPGSPSCENTGRLTDVVYHEFGHSLHRNSIIPGVGAWDGALSEGLADTLAQAITGDPGMGRGFFKSDAPLRDLDPDGVEKRWPDDVTGEVHDDGEIIGGTLWDLRVALEAALGREAGYQRFLSIFYAIMQRAADIPSSYAEALLADDDDGDLANGTPNLCVIDAVFSAHGLTDPTFTLGVEPPVRDGNRVSIAVTPRQVDLGCAAPTVASGTVAWRVRGAATTTLTPVDMTAVGDVWSANIPTQPDGAVVLYQVTLQLTDGSSVTYPRNPADPEYQFYAGNVAPLWCADFEGGLAGWTVGSTAPSRLEFEVGAPAGIGGDPGVAHGGTGVLGTDLGLTAQSDGLYRARTNQWAESPEIDLQGQTRVRLQYYRWLDVEDALYDRATIRANDQVVWTNYASASEQSSPRTHADREWRFHDVDVSAQAAAGTLKLRFQLESDAGLELGGWTVDDVCVVAAGPPSSTCGNNNLDDGERCDDGNTADGDGCPADCGISGGTDEGGCSAAGRPGGALAWSLALLGLARLRRRRRP